MPLSPSAAMLAAALWAAAAGVSVAQCNVTALTVLDVVKLSVLIRDRIFCYNNKTDEDGVRYHPLIAGFVRLAFHSSISKKHRGCLNLNDPKQAGLRLAVTELEQLYRPTRSDPYYARISRADFWALAGITAIEIASAQAVSATFLYGRCDDCVDSYETDAMIDLPDQLFSAEEVASYFNRTFGFNDYQSVAIMAGHSLGVVTDPGTGAIHGKWIANPEALSNGYFADMLNSGFRWKQAPRFYTLENRTTWSWTHGDNKRVYLNCDMGFYKRLNDVGDGLSACNYATCQLSRYNRVVSSFATSRTVFLTYFQSAFRQMLEYGHKGLRVPIGQ